MVQIVRVFRQARHGRLETGDVVLQARGADTRQSSFTTRRMQQRSVTAGRSFQLSCWYLFGRWNARQYRFGMITRHRSTLCNQSSTLKETDDWTSQAGTAWTCFPPAFFIIGLSSGVVAFGVQSTLTGRLNLGDKRLPCGSSLWYLRITLQPAFIRMSWAKCSLRRLSSQWPLRERLSNALAHGGLTSGTTS